MKIYGPEECNVVIEETIYLRYNLLSSCHQKSLKDYFHVEFFLFFRLLSLDMGKNRLLWSTDNGNK